MPFYRVPFNLFERATKEAEASKARTRAQEVVLELARCNAEDKLAVPLFAGEWIHLNFGRGKSRPLPCVVCGWISERLCDWRVGARTCDRALCECCTSSPQPGKDLCPLHELARRTWLAGRTNSTDGAG